MRNKKGSIALFLSIAISGILIFILLFIKNSANLAISSSVFSLGNLYGESVLSEYDLVLKERYGLIAVDLNEAIMEEKISYYLESSIYDKDYIKYQGCESSFDGFSLVDGNVFIKQIEKVSITNRKPNIMYLDSTDEENRYISSKWIINSLPSNCECVELNNDLVSRVSISDYIFDYFKDYMNKRDLGKTYFNNEIEYIITGKLNDKKAKENVYKEILAIRNIDNLRYLSTSEEKVAAIDALAITLMPEAPIVFKAIFLEAWAYLESKNDLELLYKGKKVPLIKDDESFALQFENVKSTIFKSKELKKEDLEDFDYEETVNENIVEPKVIKGEDYAGYLKSLILAMNPNKVVYRVMDLIQINMKYLYKESFLISDYKTGVSYIIKINNKKYEFESCY